MRTRITPFRLSEADLEILDALAAHHGLSRPAVVRMVLRDRARADGLIEFVRQNAGKKNPKKSQDSH